MINSVHSEKSILHFISPTQTLVPVQVIFVQLIIHGQASLTRIKFTAGVTANIFCTDTKHDNVMLANINFANLANQGRWVCFSVIWLFLCHREHCTEHWTVWSKWPPAGLGQVTQWSQAARLVNSCLTLLAAGHYCVVGASAGWQGGTIVRVRIQHHNYAVVQSPAKSINIHKTASYLHDQWLLTLTADSTNKNKENYI